MNCSNGKKPRDWRGKDYCPEEKTNIMNTNVDNRSYIFDETTPVKACGDLAYNVARNEVERKEFEPCRESSSQVKRRRVLQFESEMLDAPLYEDEAFLRSMEMPDSIGDDIPEISDWVAGFTEVEPAPSIECLDPSSESWIADCFNDVELPFGTEDIGVASGECDAQFDITEFLNTPADFNADTVPKQPIHTQPNVIFKGKKLSLRAPPKEGSSVVAPFAFIKPCGAQGDMTLQDINQRIHNPLNVKPNKDDPRDLFPASAFSGKPVVGKTKILTEGGKGSITIMRTKG